MVNGVMKVYAFTPASEPQLTNPLRCKKPSESQRQQGPNIILNRVLKHLLESAINFFMKV
jgi:hypothetical protein